MSGERTIRLALRGIATAIALLAFVDPAIASSGFDRPTIFVYAADSARDGALASRVAAALGKRFVVSRTPVSDADAAVIVGETVPTNHPLPAPTFVVSGDRPTVSFDEVRAPTTAALDGRVRVDALLHVAGAKGRTIEVALRVDSLVVDRAARTLAGDDDTLTVSLGFVPTRPGVARAQLVATVAGSKHESEAATVVDVRDRRWPVLFHDARPSWGSTFVRRTIEQDSRFAVASRTLTSRGVSSDVGRPPARLDDLAALGAYDAVVVGAPEALSESEVAGLDAFMRRRGGAVILSLDQRAAVPAVRLTDVSRWTGASLNRPVVLRGTNGDSSAIRAMELAWPAQVPPAARILVGDAARPIVWEIPVGAGRLIVSGALDAWRFRDPSESAFDDVWRGIVADAADATPAPIVASVTPSLVRPGEPFEVHVALRDLAIDQLVPAQATVALTLDGSPLRAWPAGVGRFDAAVRAPRDTGVHHLSLAASGTTVDVPVVVDRAAPIPAIPASLVGPWVSAHGGTIVQPSQLGDLAPRVTQALHLTPRTETRHPMRSVWWILPFTLALSAEWWMRRRRGLR